MKRKLAAAIAISVLVFFGGSRGAGAQEADVVRVEPRRTDELLTNPGMGWQTFHRFADEDKSLEGLPSASAYFRFYWREIEPVEERIDFAKFDELLAHAHRAGQKLAFRIMTTGSSEYMDVPSWLKQQGCGGVEFDYGGRKHWLPDFTDARFKRAHTRMIRGLGEHYDGHPDLDLVDIGSVGLWGEWHMSGTTEQGSGKPVPLPSLEERMAIIDEWCRAFPKSSKVIQIGSEEGMTRTSGGGFGWRADCLGDMGGFSKTWNHMNNFYLQRIKSTGAENTWQTAPVAFESCWDMRKWQESGWEIRFIFEYALRCHASYMNNKSAPIPPGTRPEVERFLRSLGYRLIIRSVEHEAAAQTGHKASVVVAWENIGVAPPYRDYRVALRLKGMGGLPFVLVGDESIRGWLPGNHVTKMPFNIPGSMPPGRYEVAIGVVDVLQKTPAIRLANMGRTEDGWYNVSYLRIGPK